MSDPRATRNADEVVLVVSPVDFTSAKCVDWLKRFNLPESTPVWVDPCVGAGSVYAMKILELLRNRWQDFTLGEPVPLCEVCYPDGIDDGDDEPPASGFDLDSCE